MGDETFKAAEQKFQQGGFAEAADLFLKISPASALWREARYNAAVCLHRVERVQDAYDVLKEVPTEKDSAKFILLKGDLLRALNSTGQALLAFESLMDAPEKKEALQGKGLCYLQMGQLPAAKRVFESALELAPNDPGVLHNCGVAARVMGKMDAAIPFFDREFAVSGSQLALAGKAESLLSSKAVEQAEEVAKSLDEQSALLPFSIHEALRVRKDEALKPAWIVKTRQLGTSALKHNDLVSALLLLEEAMRVSRGEYETSIALGRLYLRLNLLAASVLCLQIACVKEPENHAPRIALGEAFLRCKEYKRALSALQGTLGNTTSIWLYVEALLGAQEFDLAKRILFDLASGDSARLQAALAELSLKAGDKDAAHVHLAQGERYASSEPEGADRLARVAYELGEVSRAEYLCRAALSREPFSAATHALLAQVLEARGAGEESESERQFALLLQPDSN